MRSILENKFGKVNQESRLEKIIKFFQWKKNEDNYISYFSKKRTMYSDLNSGMKPEQLLPEEFLVASTVMGLDKNIQKVIFSWDKTSVTMAILESKLSNSGTIYQPIEINQVKNKKFKSRNKHRNQNEKKEKPEKFCDHCKMNNHNEPQCFTKYPHLRNKNKKNESKPVAQSNAVEMFSINAIGESNTRWLIDSGACSHMCGDSTLFDQSEDCNVQVRTANGQISTISKKGNAKIGNIELNNVLHGKQWNNIISVGNLVVDYGYTVVFEKNQSFLLKDDDKLTLERNGYLWYLPEQKEINNMELIHSRMGHLNQPAIVKMGLASGIKTHSCKTCIEGDFPKKIFSHQRDEAQVTEPLQEIYMDLSGKQSVSTFAGNQYFLGIIDYYSRFSWVYFLKTKNEAKIKIMEWIKNIERVFTKNKIVKIKTDGGGEFIDNELQSFIREKGIDFRCNIPYKHQMTGIIERYNRTVMTKTRKLIFGANLNVKFWGEALFTSNFLRNISWSKSIGTTPYQKLYGTKFPYYDRLRVFGCFAQVRIEESKRKKLEKQAKNMIFIGYDRNYYWKFYDSKQKRIIVSRDAVFYENEFNKEDFIGFDGFLLENEEHSEDEDDLENKEEEVEVTIVKQTNSPEQLIKDIIPQPQIPVKSETVKEEVKSSGKVAQKAETLESPKHKQVERLKKHDDLQKVSRGRKFLEIENEFKKKENMNKPRTTRSNRTLTPFGKECQEAKNKSIYSVNYVPNTYKQATNCEEKVQWEAAIQKEWDSMSNNDVWEVVTMPENRKCVRSKWVFDKKHDENGNLVKFKSRLVAMGCTQVEGIDYTDTYAPTVERSSIRIMLMYCLKKRFFVNQADVVSAFLQAPLEEEIYMYPPDGFRNVIGKDKVLKLRKSIYGLKQSSREFHKKLANILLKLGWKQLKSDPCIFMKNDEIIIHHVDDLLFGASSVGNYNKLIKQIDSEMKIIDQGPVKHYLKMKIDYNLEKGTCKISQPAYIMEIMEEFNLVNIQTKRTPLCPHTVLDKVELTEEEKKKMANLPFRELLGKINYLACTSRPDLSVCVTRLAQFSNCYSSSHWNQLIHVVQYLKYTKDEGIYLNACNGPLQAFSDSDWGGDRPTRRSTTGYVIKFGGSIIMWKSTLQKSVAHSTMDAEFKALAICISILIYVKNLLKEMNIFDSLKDFFCDNTSCISTLLNNNYKSKTKHNEIHFRIVREQMEKNNLRLQYVESNQNLADILTKQVTHDKLSQLKSLFPCRV